jgi:hypothetical protein
MVTEELPVTQTLSAASTNDSETARNLANWLSHNLVLILEVPLLTRRGSWSVPVSSLAACELERYRDGALSFGITMGTT